MKRPIAFPGLGIDEFYINENAFSINIESLDFRLDVKWYGVIISLGLLMAAIYCMCNAKRFGLKADDILDAVIIGGPLGIIGARLYYVLFSLDEFSSFMDVINLRNGGLAIYGVIIMIVLVAPWFCKFKKIKMPVLLDLVSYGLLIGQCIGRWGNFFNVEVYGSTTSLPWGMEITRGYNKIIVHPLFLYESLWTLAGFIFLHFYGKKRKFDGEIFLMYMGWYGLGRALIEGLRVEAYVLKLGTLKISQVFGILFFVASIVLLIIFRMKTMRKTQEQQDFVSLLDNTPQTENIDTETTETIEITEQKD